MRHARRMMALLAVGLAMSGAASGTTEPEKDRDGVTEAQEERAIKRLNQEINSPDPKAPDELDRRYEDLEMPGDRDSELDQLLENE